MGTTSSRPAPLAPVFERMSSWDIKAAKRLLSDYKEKDMDFGLDANGLSDLIGNDAAWAERILDAFSSSNGIVNALAFICGACLISAGAALEKAGVVFDALDFDASEQIAMDEMTIVFLCCARGLTVMSGVGTVPTDESLEAITLQAYRELNKTSGQTISKNEFTKWIIKYLSIHIVPNSEPSIDDVMQHFGLVPPPVTALAAELAAVTLEEPNGNDNNGASASTVSPNEKENAQVPGNDPLSSEESRKATSGEPLDSKEQLTAASTEPVSNHEDIEIPPVEATKNETEANTLGSEDSNMNITMSVSEDPIAARPESESGSLDPSAVIEANGDATEPNRGINLNAYDTYAFDNTEFDASSGLPPPEPEDVLPPEQKSSADGSVAATPPTEETIS